MAEFLTVKEAAGVAKCGHFTVQKWVRDGKLKAARPTGGKTLIERTDLERFLRGEHLKAN